MISVLAERYRKSLKDRIDETIHMNGTGHADDWAGYRHRVGIYKGLSEALHEFNEIIKHLDDDDE